MIWFKSIQAKQVDLETSSLARSLRDRMHWSPLRSLLRTYERLTCSKSTLLILELKGLSYARTQDAHIYYSVIIKAVLSINHISKVNINRRQHLQIYSTCTSPIMHLICPPKFCISIVFNFSWDGCNTQEIWKTKVMQNLGGANKVHYGECGSGVYRNFTTAWVLKVSYSSNASIRLVITWTTDVNLRWQWVWFSVVR